MPLNKSQLKCTRKKQSQVNEHDKDVIITENIMSFRISVITVFEPGETSRFQGDEYEHRCPLGRSAA
jgi:hypothetical protein